MTLEKEIKELHKGKSLEWYKGFNAGVRFVRKKIGEWIVEDDT